MGNMLFLQSWACHICKINLVWQEMKGPPSSWCSHIYGARQCEADNEVPSFAKPRSFQTQISNQQWMWGEPTLTWNLTRKDHLKETWDTSDYALRSSLTFLVESLLTVWHCPQPKTVHKQLHKPRYTAGFCLFPSIYKVGSVTFSSFHLKVFFGKRETTLRKGRFAPYWHWDSHWVTGSSSTAIALFKMQNVDVFRGHISINHCMQILLVEKRFPSKSLFTALIELALLTEGTLNSWWATDSAAPDD